MTGDMWGEASFDNQSASDWFEDFVANPQPKRINDALLAVDGSEDLRACQCALVAAEVVAAWRGQPPADLPSTLVPFSFGHSPALPAEMLALAMRTVRGIQGGSLLRDHWREQRRLPSFNNHLDGLLARLGARASLI
jgi:hypothetical protein